VNGGRETIVVGVVEDEAEDMEEEGGGGGGHMRPEEAASDHEAKEIVGQRIEGGELEEEVDEQFG
jgi:hypothetical protein